MPLQLSAELQCPKNLDCSSEVCASQIVAMRIRLTPMSSATRRHGARAGRGMSAEPTPARTWNDGTTRRRGTNRASIIAADEYSLSHKPGAGSGQVAVRPAVRLGFTDVRRRIVGFKSRRGGFALKHSTVR